MYTLCKYTKLCRRRTVETPFVESISKLYSSLVYLARKLRHHLRFKRYFGPQKMLGALIILSRVNTVMSFLDDVEHFLDLKDGKIMQQMWLPV